MLVEHWQIEAVSVISGQVRREVCGGALFLQYVDESSPLVQVQEGIGGSRPG